MKIETKFNIGDVVSYTGYSKGVKKCPVCGVGPVTSKTKEIIAGTIADMAVSFLSKGATELSEASELRIDYSIFNENNVFWIAEECLTLVKEK